MSLAGILVFALGVAVAMAAPGPVVAALIARIIGRGAHGIAPFCLGLIAGDIVWFGAAMLGLAALMQAAQPVFLALKYAGAAYLLWLAWRLCTAPAAAPAAQPLARAEGWRGFAGGLLLTLGNPKTMVFYLALAPTLVDAASLTPARFALLALVLAAVYTLVLAAYVLLAARARRLFRSARSMRQVNRAAGGLMAGAAVAVAAR